MKLNKRILTYLIMLVLIYVYPVLYIAQNGGINKHEGMAVLIMWAPALSAIITKLVFDRSLRGLGFGIKRPWYLIVAYLIPLAAGTIVYVIAWGTGIGGTDFSHTTIIDFIGILGVMGSMITSVGEEIGWNGFLIPELASRYSFVGTCLMMALIWNVFHYPIILFGGYNNGRPSVLAILFFTIELTAFSFITTWLRLRTGSFWPAAILHGAHNYYIQSVFDIITVDKGRTKLFTTEFGIGLMVVYSLIAFLIFRIYTGQVKKEGSRNGI